MGVRIPLLATPISNIRLAHAVRVGFVSGCLRPRLQSSSHHVKRVALVFYSTLSASALLWGWSMGRVNLLWNEDATTPRAAAGVLLGGLFAAMVVATSRWLLRFSWASELAAWFQSVLGPLTWLDAAILAALSALGEELFFRGAMQRAWGIGPALLVFSLAHLPPRLKLAPWTLSAAAIGLPIALCAAWSGSLAGPILAHFLINLLNLKQVSDSGCGHTAAPRRDEGPSSG